MRQNEVIKIDDATWSIEDGFVRFFLLKGEEKALLIDSGVDIEGVRPLACAILKQAAQGGPAATADPGEKIIFPAADDADLGEWAEYPLELLNTHGDGDHCHGNREFPWFYMHEADWDCYRSQFGDECDMVSVNDGDILDLGNRPLEIIFIPGHTHGSIAVLDISRRALYPGDSVQDGDIFMFGGHRNLDEYPASMMKLQEMEDRFDVIYASHSHLIMEPEAIGDCFDACESIFHGEVEPEEREVHGTLVNAYDCGTATFLIDKDRVFEDADED